MVVAYRFCQPGDVPLLALAVNECAASRLRSSDRRSPEGYTVVQLNREREELDLCLPLSLVALTREGRDPVGVCQVARRGGAGAVLRLAVRPGHRRRGIGRSLLTALRRKARVLGLEGLQVDVPADAAAALALFTGLGWQRGPELTDRVRPAPDPGAQPVPEDLVIPVTLRELEGAEALLVSPQAPWERRLQVLHRRADHLVGAAVGNPERVEAYVLAEPLVRWGGRSGGEATDGRTGGALDVLSAAAHEPQRAEFLLGLLFRWLAHAAGRPLRIARLVRGEIPSAALAAAGFEIRRAYARFDLDPQGGRPPA